MKITSLIIVLCIVITSLRAQQPSYVLAEDSLKFKQILKDSLSISDSQAGQILVILRKYNLQLIAIHQAQNQNVNELHRQMTESYQSRKSDLALVLNSQQLDKFHRLMAVHSYPQWLLDHRKKRMDEAMQRMSKRLDSSNIKLALKD